MLPLLINVSVRNVKYKNSPNRRLVIYGLVFRILCILWLNLELILKKVFNIFREEYEFLYESIEYEESFFFLLVRIKLKSCTLFIFIFLSQVHLRNFILRVISSVILANI